jgi:hypothetical protein
MTQNGGKRTSLGITGKVSLAQQSGVGHGEYRTGKNAPVLPFVIHRYGRNATLSGPLEPSGSKEVAREGGHSTSELLRYVANVPVLRLAQ